MFCKKCGKQISDGVQFCPNCGASQESSAKEENAVTVQPAQNASGVQESKATGYASTALKAAVFGLLCWCCCGCSKTFSAFRHFGGDEIIDSLLVCTGNVKSRYTTGGS